MGMPKRILDRLFRGNEIYPAVPLLWGLALAAVVAAVLTAVLAVLKVLHDQPPDMAVPPAPQETTHDLRPQSERQHLAQRGSPATDTAVDQGQNRGLGHSLGYNREDATSPHDADDPDPRTACCAGTLCLAGDVAIQPEAESHAVAELCAFGSVDTRINIQLPPMHDLPEVVIDTVERVVAVVLPVELGDSTRAGTAPTPVFAPAREAPPPQPRIDLALAIP